MDECRCFGLFDCMVELGGLARDWCGCGVVVLDLDLECWIGM